MAVSSGVEDSVQASRGLRGFPDVLGAVAPCGYLHSYRTHFPDGEVEVQGREFSDTLFILLFLLSLEATQREFS